MKINILMLLKICKHYDILHIILHVILAKVLYLVKKLSDIMILKSSRVMFYEWIRLAFSPIINQWESMHKYYNNVSSYSSYRVY